MADDVSQSSRCSADGQIADPATHGLDWTRIESGAHGPALVRILQHIGGMRAAHAHRPHVEPDPRQRLGRDGEAAARAALRSHGYVILAERYRVARGEVDIVARDHQTIVFIEVKTRRAEAFGGGAAAVTWRKQRTIVRVAEAFIARGRLAHLPCRFDVVSVEWPPGEGPRAEIIRGAFDAT